LARNIGINNSHGEFLIFLDDDVRVDEYFIVKCLNLSKDFIVFSFRIINPDDPRPMIVKAIHSHFVGKIVLSLGLIFGGFELERYSKMKISVDHFPGTAFVVKREIVGNLRFDEYLGKGNGYLEDTDFTYSLRKKGHTLAFVTGYSIRHERAPEGGNRVHDISEWLNQKWLYYYWNHKAYFVKKHGGVLRLATATFVNFIECVFISMLTRRFFVKTFLEGWFDGVRAKHRV
jgi:GT2 family glycosyltransferase